MIALLIAVALSRDCWEVVHDHYDVVEVNHYHGEHGQPIFVQLVWWDWDYGRKTHCAQEWRMMRHCWDTTDKQHERRFWQAVAVYVQQYRDFGKRSQIRRCIKYRGKFIGGPMYPRRMRDGSYECRWNDRGIERRVTADSMRETCTQFDSEKVDRDRWPTLIRRRLSEPPTKLIK